MSFFSESFCERFTRIMNKSLISLILLSDKSNRSWALFCYDQPEQIGVGVEPEPKPDNKFSSSFILKPRFRTAPAPTTLLYFKGNFLHFLVKSTIGNILQLYLVHNC